MRALVDRKVTNKITQMNNRLAEFATPVMRNYDLYVYRNFVVSGNEEIKGNSEIHGNLTVDGNEEVKGNVTIDGDEQVKGDVTVNGNINADGYILAQTFLPGQIINMSMYSKTDIGQFTETGQTYLTVAATVTRNIFTFTYTPKYSTSYLIIEYQTVYYLGGGGNDEAYAFLKVAGDRISQSFQKWTSSMGGGDRSGVLFPLIGRYTNTSRSSKTIAVDLYNGTDADPITVNSDISTWLKITEIAR